MAMMNRQAIQKKTHKRICGFKARKVQLPWKTKQRDQNNGVNTLYESEIARIFILYTVGSDENGENWINSKSIDGIVCGRFRRCYIRR